ncbi:MAG: type-F conjugative transfer system pilin assembly protein TrbC [Nitrosomonas sp.]|uniref:Conjugal transfer pilus assembly protein TrbC n=1 Tax=Nitrosomonas aestuarii TaxID=52441 RepID=A0A1I4DJT4_9PROT|nr:type-F conjugative transfer system pilin assembly protein TrbC [Nitrosomonas aestuarii]MBX3630319.1 type-F conjugative transfer system pilin assembly protein TrbC [Nitrosomonas sp.]SFK93179.1 conjugal transfer pilus assembly protein TrbC [Nitrosomonas aestuarii]
MVNQSKTISIISFLYLFLLAWFLLPVSSLPAQEPAFELPTDEATRAAQQRARNAMNQLPGIDGGQPNLMPIPSMPEIDTLPKANTPQPDILSIARKYRELGNQSFVIQAQPDLLVLVSLSMPHKALVRIAEQAELSGATLVFRGLQNDSMQAMDQAIQAIAGRSNVSIAIHPPAFQQFSVDQVPVFVIASQEAGNVMENGCSEDRTFIKVSGDVSIDYALEYIERMSADWREIAKQYRQKIVRGIQ